jgi:hypothetical protein
MHRIALLAGVIGLVASIAAAIVLSRDEPIQPIARVGPGIPSAGFILRNDTGESVTVRRFDPLPAHPRRLELGETMEVNQTHAWLRDFDWTDLNRGTALTLEVVDASGASRGRIAFTPSYMRGLRGFTVCLSAASDPTYVVDQYQDVAVSCREAASRGASLIVMTSQTPPGFESLARVCSGASRKRDGDQCTRGISSREVGYG